MKKIKWILLFFVTSAIFIGCNDSSSTTLYDYLDNRLEDEIVTIQHVNPISGETETGVLEGVYQTNQSVKISLSTVKTVKKVSVVNSATKELVDDVDINGTSASFEYLVEDLDIPFGQMTNLTFYLYYDDMGEEGFDYPSMKIITYKVISDIPPVTKFYSQSGSSTDIIIRDNFGGDYSVDENGDVVLSFEENDEDPLYAVYPDLSYLQFGTGDFSLSFWLNTTTNFSDPALFATMDWASSSNHGWILAWGGYDLRFVMTDADGNKTDVSWAEGTLPNYGVWHHIVVSVDRDDKVVIYIDGTATLDATSATPGSLDNGSPIHLNQDRTGNYGDHFHGSYKDIRFYNYPLSAQDVSDIYSGS